MMFQGRSECCHWGRHRHNKLFGRKFAPALSNSENRGNVFLLPEVSLMKAHRTVLYEDRKNQALCYFCGDHKASITIKTLTPYD